MTTGATWSPPCAATMTAQPRYATVPDPAAQHDTGSVIRLARALHRPLLPWQVLAVRLGTERSVEDPRRYRYREIRVSVPRQSGKTTTAHVKNLHRTIRHADRQAFYTAQTGKDARERWADARKLVEGCQLGRFVKPGNPHGGKIMAGAGAESITWPNGSQLRPFAPTAASLHGYTPDTVDEDEVWKYDELQGQALDGAIGPAQITLPHAQRWLYSTMGDADSTYWHRLVDEGREWTADPDAPGAYIEYSADPDTDLYDPAVWATFHPAFGLTIDAVDLAAAADRETPGTWQRAYCNLRTSTRETVVDMETFAALGKPDLRMAGKGSVLSFDVAHDSSQASVALSRAVGEDSVATRIVKSAQGVAWLVDDLVKYQASWSIPEIHCDDGGPARDITDELRRRGRTVDALGARDYATACGAWLRRTRDGRLIHDGSDVLTDAMRAASVRPMGDAMAVSRRHSAGPVDALVACIVGIRAALLAPIPAPKPEIRG